MAEFIEAIFKAQEGISDALDEISRASQVTEQQMLELEKEFVKADEAGDLLRNSTERLAQEHQQAVSAFKNYQQAINSADRTVQEYENGVITAKEAGERMENHLRELSSATAIADASLNNLEQELKTLVKEGAITTQTANELQDAVENIGISSLETSLPIRKLANNLRRVRENAEKAADSANQYSGTLQVLTSSLTTTALGFRNLERSAERSAEGVRDARNAAFGAAGAFATLNSAISETILNFGSLSVNIGPFNIALRNFITQVPAILTGMGSMVSMITALIAGFGTLAVVTGTLLAGGAIAFFQDFAEQFEESSEAVEAMMAALKDLFVEALQPVINDTNSDFFVSTIDAMARAINRFAQFVSQMRNEVMVVFNSLEGDMDDFFNALRDTFLLLRPVVIGLINFFTEDFAPILRRMGALSENLSDDINTLITTLGALLSQLLDLAGTILAGVAPAARILVGFLTLLAATLNALPSQLLSNIVFIGIMAIAIFKLIGAITGVIVSLITLNSWLVTSAVTGGFLGAVYLDLVAAARLYASGNYSLVTSLAVLKSAIVETITLHLKSAHTKIQDALATQVLSQATSGFIKWVKTSVVWKKLDWLWTHLAAKAKYVLVAAIGLVSASAAAEAAAISFTSIAMSVYTAITGAAATVTWGLVGAIAALLAPITLTGVLLAGLVFALSELLGITNFTGGLIDFFKGLASWISDIFDMVKGLVGMSGDVAGAEIDKGEIQTSSNVDLSFEDKVEQQVDVQADPEDKEGLRRIVKDAMNEANSIARRQEGLGR